MRIWMAGLVLLVVGTAGAAEVKLDAYGGTTDVKGKRTGYFHVEQIDGTWWIITPDGNGFFSKGVCHVSFDGDKSPALDGASPYKQAAEAKYKTADAWAKATIERLKGWGFNTIGAWSSKELAQGGIAYTVNLDLAAKTVPDMWVKALFPDLFDPAVVEKIQKRAEDVCKPLKDDPWLLGYFLDNEIHWQRDWRSDLSIIEIFLSKLPPESPGHKKAKAFLAARNNNAEPTEDDKQAFMELCAKEYFRICHEAVRKVDANHMILGCRFAGTGPELVLAAMKDHVDIASANYYQFPSPTEKLQRIHELTGRPVMLTEFSFKAMDSGLPNTKGGGRPLRTQEQRAALFESWALSLSKAKFVVGYHWFQYADQPRQGRFDGENNNYGMVKIDDSPWEALTERMKRVNAKTEQLHAGK